MFCPLGNYPKGELFPEYKRKFSVTENRSNITVKRLWIYPSVSKNLIVRLFSVLSFTLSLFFYLLFKKTPKKIIVQSPPLLISFISVFVLSLKNKKIILNISDLWPLAAIELNAIKKGSFTHRFSMFLEKFIYQKATLILGQSNEIITHVETIVPSKPCYLYRNFPDQKLRKSPLRTDINEPIKLFYAGLLGVAQGVLELCKNVDLKNLHIELHLFGDGAERKKIEEFLANDLDKKIQFHGMLTREELLNRLETFDIAIVPLKTRIYGSVPSKIFEYGSLGFPILYFGGGEGESIILENKMGWVIPVGQFKDLNQQLIEISIMDKRNLAVMKNEIFNVTKTSFDLDNQLADLIQKEVF